MSGTINQGCTLNGRAGQGAWHGDNHALVLIVISLNVLSAYLDTLKKVFMPLHKIIF
jgi:hypothetical protein